VAAERVARDLPAAELKQALAVPPPPIAIPEGGAGVGQAVVGTEEVERSGPYVSPSTLRPAAAVSFTPEQSLSSPAEPVTLQVMLECGHVGSQPASFGVALRLVQKNGCNVIMFDSVHTDSPNYGRVRVGDELASIKGIAVEPDYDAVLARLSALKEQGPIACEIVRQSIGDAAPLSPTILQLLPPDWAKSALESPPPAFTKAAANVPLLSISTTRLFDRDSSLTRANTVSGRVGVPSPHSVPSRLGLASTTNRHFTKDSPAKPGFSPPTYYRAPPASARPAAISTGRLFERPTSSALPALNFGPPAYLPTYYRSPDGAANEGRAVRTGAWAASSSYIDGAVQPTRYGGMFTYDVRSFQGKTGTTLNNEKQTTTDGKVGGPDAEPPPDIQSLEKYEVAAGVNEVCLTPRGTTPIKKNSCVAKAAFFEQFSK